MPALMKFVETYKGINIFQAANTHPRAATTSVTVYASPAAKYITSKRFRYRAHNLVEYLKALQAARNYIDKNL